MRGLRGIHKPPGYEGWKDETTIRRPNIRAILATLALCFVCGGVSVGVALTLNRGNQAAPVPTLVTMDMITTPTATQRYNVLVMQQPKATATPPPTATPEQSPTPDLEATLDYMVAQRVTEPPPTMAAATAVPIFCEGAPFTRYEHSAVLRVTFEDKGALRLLDRPRDGVREPDVLKQLYDGDTVVIQGDPVCGAWQGLPVAYYPVYVSRWDRSGYVGFGQSDDVWLEPNRP